MISKNDFIQAMSDVEKAYNYQKGLNSYFKKCGVEGTVFQPDCVSTTLHLLHNIFIEKDKADWIEYFCYELNFGKKYKDGEVKDSSGNNVVLATSEDLYMLLTEGCA